MAIERVQNKEDYVEGILEFVKICEKRMLVNSFRIKGEEGHENLPHTIFGIRVIPNTEFCEVLSLRTERYKKGDMDLVGLYPKIRRLSLPNEASLDNARENLPFAEQVIASFTSKGMPYLALFFGRSDKTGEEMINLLSVAGYSAQRALAEIKGFCE